MVGVAFKGQKSDILDIGVMNFMVGAIFKMLAWIENHLAYIRRGQNMDSILVIFNLVKSENQKIERVVS